MFYQRRASSKIEAEMKTPKIIVLTGMRHTGKTTILEESFKTSALAAEILRL